MKTKGFTRTELLVVIGVIAMLAATVVPALAATGQWGREAACLGNMRSLALAILMYEIDEDGLLPRNNWWWEEFPGWEEGGPLAGPRSGPRWWCNKVYRYVQSPEVFVCAEYIRAYGPRTTPLPLRPRQKPRREPRTVECTYGFNQVLVRRKITRASELPDPGRTFVVGHTSWTQLDPRIGAFQVDPKRWPGVHFREEGPFWEHTDGKLYQVGRCGYIFGDHHVETMEYQEVRDNRDAYYYRKGSILDL